jgi:hypothetical protein
VDHHHAVPAEHANVALGFYSLVGTFPFHQVTGRIRICPVCAAALVAPALPGCEHRGGQLRAVARPEPHLVHAERLGALTLCGIS